MWTTRDCRTLLSWGMAVFLSLATPALAGEPPRIAWVWPGTPEGTATVRAAFLEGLRENGLAEGKDYVLDERYAAGNFERFPALVDELLARAPAVIMLNQVVSVRAAQKATKTVPIVFVYTHDPVGNGLVASLARPGGNTTGLSTQFEDLIEKYLELLRELLPRASRLAVLTNPQSPPVMKFSARVSAVAGTMGIEARSFEVGRIEAIGPAFEAMARYKPDALLVIPDPLFFDQRTRLSALAVAQRLPAIVPQSEYAAAGCLVAFGAARREVFRRSAIHVKKILDGANPGELPVEQPTRFELVVNMKTAKTLGITVPQSLVLRADEVIR